MARKKKKKGTAWRAIKRQKENLIPRLINIFLDRNPRIDSLHAWFHKAVKYSHEDIAIALRNYTEDDLFQELYRIYLENPRRMARIYCFQVWKWMNTLCYKQINEYKCVESLPIEPEPIYEMDTPEKALTIESIFSGNIPALYKDILIIDLYRLYLLKQGFNTREAREITLVNEARQFFWHLKRARKIIRQRIRDQRT